MSVKADQAQTIDRRKKGWLPPDYGLRELRDPR
jgi:hypothetical protein